MPDDTKTETVLRIIDEQIAERKFVTKKEVSSLAKTANPDISDGAITGIFDNRNRGKERHYGKGIQGKRGKYRKTNYKGKVRGSAAICHVDFDPEIDSDDDFFRRKYEFEDTEFDAPERSKPVVYSDAPPPVKTAEITQQNNGSNGSQAPDPASREGGQNHDASIVTKTQIRDLLEKLGINEKESKRILGEE